MGEDKKENIEGLMSILMELDKNSLLIIDSGARMLLARQCMDNNECATFQSDQNPFNG